MRALALLFLLLTGCTSAPVTFEAYRTHNSIPLAKFAPTKIPDSGIDWKMREYLRYADNPDIAHVNFAGRCSVFVVGCGTGCAEYCVIDRATGVVYPQAAYQCDFPNEWDGPTRFQFRPDSRLMTIYWAEGFAWPVHIEHYVWDGKKMDRLQSEAVQKPIGAPEPSLTFGVRPIDLIKPNHPPEAASPSRAGSP